MGGCLLSITPLAARRHSTGIGGTLQRAAQQYACAFQRRCLPTAAASPARRGSCPEHCAQHQRVPVVIIRPAAVFHRYGGKRAALAGGAPPCVPGGVPRRTLFSPVHLRSRQTLHPARWETIVAAQCWRGMDSAPLAAGRETATWPENRVEEREGTSTPRAAPLAWAAIAVVLPCSRGV